MKKFEDVERQLLLMDLHVAQRMECRACAGKPRM